MNLLQVQIDLLKEEKKEILKKQSTGSYYVSANDDVRLTEIDEILKKEDFLIVSPERVDRIDIGVPFKLEIDYGDDDKEIMEGVLVEQRITTEPHDKFITTISPLGEAIHRLSLGEDFSYTVNKTNVISGRILEINLPTEERMAELVKKRNK